MISENKIKKYFHLLNELKDDYCLYDLHIHPFEFFFGDIKYQAYDDSKAIFCRKSTVFIPPKISSIEKLNGSALPMADRLKFRADFYRLLFARQFQCTGAGVFEAFAEITGITKFVLLPVATEKIELQNQLDLMKSYFADANRFIFGCYLPDDVKDNEISAYLFELKKNYHVRIVKIHPNFSAINLATYRGIERIEAILHGCNQTNLPLIIHGGRNAILNEKQTDRFSEMINLKKIQWSLTKTKVIIAHAGAYDVDGINARNEVFTHLKALLKKYDNLMFDLSGLSYEATFQAIKMLGLSRAVFGSDALYFDPIRAMAILLHCIENAGLNLKKSLIRVAHENPETCKFRGME